MARDDEIGNRNTNPLYSKRPGIVADNAAATDQYTPEAQAERMSPKTFVRPVAATVVSTPEKKPSRIRPIDPIALSNATDGGSSTRVYPNIGANQLPNNRIQQIGDAQYVMHPASHVGSGIPTDPNFQPPSVPKEWGNKGHGYFGALKRPDGKVSTELDVGVKLDGPDGEETRIPLLVPTQSHDDIQHMLTGKKETPAMLQTAITHAQARKQLGLSPFAYPGERYDMPPPPSGEAYIPPGYVETIRGTQRSLHNPTTNHMMDSGNVMDYQNSIQRRTDPNLIDNTIHAEAAKAVAATHAGASIRVGELNRASREEVINARVQGMRDVQEMKSMTDAHNVDQRFGNQTGEFAPHILRQNGEYNPQGATGGVDRFGLPNAQPKTQRIIQQMNATALVPAGYVPSGKFSADGKIVYINDAGNEFIQE